MDRSRRNFFRKYCLGNAAKFVSDVHTLVSHVHTSFKEAESDTDYFDSYETCYPLISEYSYFLDDEVKDLGIETDGKSKLDIVKTVYEKKGRND
jgi:hypothetical protein